MAFLSRSLRPGSGPHRPGPDRTRAWATELELQAVQTPETVAPGRPVGFPNHYRTRLSPSDEELETSAGHPVTCLGKWVLVVATRMGSGAFGLKCVLIVAHVSLGVHTLF